MVEASTRTIRCGAASLSISSLNKDEYATNIEMTGLAVWFAATNMCNYVSANLSQFDLGSTLELGSGTGLVGLMLLSLRENRELERKAVHSSASSSSSSGSGSSEAEVEPLEPMGDQGNVILTDGPEEVMTILRGNIARNRRGSTGAGTGKGTGSGNGNGSCEQLWWGKSLQLRAFQGRPDGGRSHNILGSDLFYNSSQRGVVELCFETVEALLSHHEAARFHLSFTRRNLDIGVVLAVALAAGFSAELADDFCYDLWGNNTEGCTELWRDAIYSFSRIPRHAFGDAVPQLEPESVLVPVLVAVPDSAGDKGAE